MFTLNFIIHFLVTFTGEIGALLKGKVSLTPRAYVYGVPRLVRLSLGAQVDVYCADKLTAGSSSKRSWTYS